MLQYHTCTCDGNDLVNLFLVVLIRIKCLVRDTLVSIFRPLSFTETTSFPLSKNWSLFITITPECQTNFNAQIQEQT